MTRFQTEIQDNVKRVERIAKETKALFQADELFGSVDLSDVAYTSVYIHSSGVLHVALTLKEDKKDSRLAHVLARKLDCTFLKSKDWSGEALQLKARNEAAMWEVIIEGVVPRTCEIIVTEEQLTAEEIETARAAALASVSSVRVKREICCK
jgi:hypothetical protein